jgi:hypothetical protein
MLLDCASMRESGSPVKLEILGFLPTLFSSKCKVFCNPTGVVGVRSFDQQLEEYPEHIRRNQERAAQIFESISKDFPGQVVVRVVNPTSVRGLWLTLRQRVKHGLWLILEGRTVLDAYSDYSAMQREIRSEIASKAASGLVR